MSEISKRGRIIKKIVERMNNSEHFLDIYKAELYDRDDMDIPYRYPNHLSVKMIELKNFKMELLTSSLCELNSQYVILHIHGGGYISAMRTQYKKLAGFYSEVSGGASVLTIDYRVAPKDPYPAALEDALASYDWLINNGYSEEKIILAGDSAGAGLAMALCYKLKELGRKLPAGIVAMSPWADLTASGPSYKENKDIDPVFGGERAEMIYESPYIGEANPKDPTISPIYGDFKDFPPMLIQCGTDEMLKSDSDTVAKKAKEAGVLVRYTVYEGMFHVFQMAGTYMDESKRAWSEVGAFMKHIITKP